MESEIIHGDCREILSILDFTRPIDCLLTDPPYGVDFQSTYGKNEEDRERYQRKIADDHGVEDAIESFDATMKLIAPNMADECEIYVFSAWQVAPEWQHYLGSLGHLGIELRQLLIWEKGYPGIGDVKYNWGCGHEFIYYLKKGKRPVPYRRSGILHVDKVRPGTNVHPTQKPTALLKILIEYSTDEGDLVFDPYAGSGSTVVAAQELGRIGIGIEVEEDYVTSARSRLSQGGLFSL
jgi:site-specific DNA-methyltransferase (adenine-specific)